MSVSRGIQAAEHPSDVWLLQELVTRLSHTGYSEYCASFNPLSPRTTSWCAHWHDIPDKLRPFVDLFLLARPVTLNDVIKTTLEDLIDRLCLLGLLEYSEGGQLATADLILLPVFGNWLFFQKPQVNPMVYYGDDSMALLVRLRPKRRGRCLDLCAGSGVQALHCSLFADTVTAVEINPVAANLACLNTVMNGRQDIVTVHCGDLYEPIQGQVFDTIIANPPLIPFPDDTPYPFVGHGGSDGLRVTWRILRGLSTALAPDGTAQLIGACLSDGERPLITAKLDHWACEAHMDVLLTITAHQPLRPGTSYFDGLTYSAAVGTNSDLDRIKAEYQRSLAEQGASHLCPYFLHVVRGRGSLQIQNLARDGFPGLWYTY